MAVLCLQHSPARALPQGMELSQALTEQLPCVSRVLMGMVSPGRDVVSPGRDAASLIYSTWWGDDVGPLLVLIGTAPLIATNTQQLTAGNELNHAQRRSLIPLTNTPKHLPCSGPCCRPDG